MARKKPWTTLRLSYGLLSLLLSFCLTFQLVPAACAQDQLEPGTADSPETVIADPPILAYADSSQSQQIDSLTEEIIAKELELLRLNTHYRIESTKVSKIKHWRLFLYNMGLFTCTNVGIDHIAYARWHTWQRPARARKDFLSAGPILLLTGHCIAIGGALIEKSIDVWNDHRLKRKGFDDRTCMRKVKELRVTIEDMLSRRADLVNRSDSLSNSERDALLAEGAVLRDVKDSALVEFSRFYIRTKKFRAGRDAGYFSVFAQAAPGGFMGSLFALLAVRNRKPRLAFTSGLGFTLSGGVIVMSPFFTKLTMKLAERYTRGRVQKELPGIDGRAFADFDADRQRLEAALSSAPGGYVLDRLRERMPIYAKTDPLLDRAVGMAKAEAKQSNKEWWERVFVTAVIGGTKMGYGIQLMNAGLSFRQRPATPTVRVNIPFGRQVVKAPVPVAHSASSNFSKRVAEAATTFIPGTATGLADTFQLRLRGELRDYRLKKAGIHPGQVLKDRLNSLDQLEAAVGKH